MPAQTSFVRAQHHAVSSGHALASAAAMEILDEGGNAVDAGVAAGIALGVLHSDLVNFAGVAPIVLRMADTGRVVTIDGLGHWPRAASVEWFERHCDGAIPEGLLRTVVPAAPAAWIRALRDYGTIGFGRAARAAIRHARDGFPVFALLERSIRENESAYRRTAATAAVYLPGGRPPKLGENFVQSDLAQTLQYMVDEEAAAGGDRVRGLAAAHDAFYRGDIAASICAHHERNGGLLRRADLADYQVRIEAPITVRFADCDFYCCGAWSQGISMAQTLAMMEACGARSMRPDSPDYVHLLTELYKLVFADREAFVADPRFVDVPVNGLLAADYLKDRLRRIDMRRAAPDMPDPGLPRSDDGSPTKSTATRNATPTSDRRNGPPAPDTSHVGVIDRWGNMFSATPSDPSYDTEVIPGTGLCPSSRGSQSRGTAASINALAPGKRPRLTPNPVLALRGGQPMMTLGTPGGDVQVQAMTQVLAKLLWFGADLRSAIEAPRFATYSFPSSFAPNESFPGLLMLEPRLGDEVGSALEARGHRVGWWEDRSWKAGGVCAVMVDANQGGLVAGADPRRASSAAGR